VVHFAAHGRYEGRYGQFAWAPASPSLTLSDSSKVTGKWGLNYKAADHLLLYADFRKGSATAVLTQGLPDVCYRNGTDKYVPDTLNNYELGWKSTPFLNGRPHGVQRRGLSDGLAGPADHDRRRGHLRDQQLQRGRRQGAASTAFRVER
jgi:hypothetical protein